MASDRTTFAEIQAQRHKEAHEREEQARKWSEEVTVQLANEQSTFLAEFSEAEKRIFGLIK